MGREGTGLPNLETDWDNIMVDFLAHTEQVSGYFANQQVAKLSIFFELEQRHRGLDESEKQLRWLEKQLHKAWRLKQQGHVAWTVVIAHRGSEFGGYCSSSDPFLLCFRAGQPVNRIHNLLEDLFFKFEVDLHLSGHTHAYERTFPVYKFEKQANETVETQTGAEQSTLVAPIYVVAPSAMDGSHGGIYQEDDDRFWQVPRPPYVAQRLSPHLAGHLELNVSSTDLDLKLIGQVQVLDSLHLARPDAEHRTAFVARALGGRHMLPTRTEEEETCKEALKSEAHPEMVWRYRAQSSDFGRACFASSGRAFWRILASLRDVVRFHFYGRTWKVHSRVDEIIRGKRWYLAMAFFAFLKEAQRAHAADEVHHGRSLRAQLGSAEEPTLDFVEFGLCLPSACDFADLAGPIALPFLLNRTGKLRNMPVGFANSWFRRVRVRATRCNDVAAVVQPGVFDGGVGEEVPRVDLVVPGSVS
eukprot:gnl/TRDRNA2_/TRDRNA2_168004_c0_seq3.p1 gnl/TRDRNA2_/TRDRNA2_168004_c0~~gnl/TRDRNA2_/TRDRNA2_168004_c0_seq3.p1  ORF type:complete len:483 (-),score=58.85 gnl/TRDRNA2_/TRDRNA2_168004_c0_seq3:55-1470(-)